MVLFSDSIPRVLFTTPPRERHRVQRSSKEAQRQSNFLGAGTSGYTEESWSASFLAIRQHKPQAHSANDEKATTKAIVSKEDRIRLF